MNRLNIVLVEPQIPQNTGNISRTCAVTGAALHLVKPYGFTITDKQLKRAGLDYWDKLDIYEYDNLDSFFEQNEGAFYFFTTKGRKVHSEADYPQDKNVFLIFGRDANFSFIWRTKTTTCYCLYNGNEYAYHHS